MNSPSKLGENQGSLFGRRSTRNRGIAPNRTPRDPENNHRSASTFLNFLQGRDPHHHRRQGEQRGARALTNASSRVGRPRARDGGSARRFPPPSVSRTTLAVHALGFLPDLHPHRGPRRVVEIKIARALDPQIQQRGGDAKWASVRLPDCRTTSAGSRDP